MKNQCCMLWNILFCCLHFTISLFRYRVLSPLTDSLHLLSQLSSSMCRFNSQSLLLHLASLFMVDFAFILLFSAWNYDYRCCFISISLMILSLAVTRYASSTPFSAYTLLSLLKEVQKQSSGLLCLECLFLVVRSVSMVAVREASGMKASCLFSTILCNLFLRQELISSWQRCCNSSSTAETERKCTRLLLLPVVLRGSWTGLQMRGVVCGRAMLNLHSSCSKGDGCSKLAHRSGRVDCLAVRGGFSGFLGFLYIIENYFITQTLPTSHCIVGNG